MNDDFEKYIQKIEKNPETGENEIWLHNLPKDEALISVFRKIKNKYHSNRLIIEDKIDLSGITINEEINFSNCVFNKEIDFWNTIFVSRVDFSNSKFPSKVNFCGVDNFSTISFWGSEFFSEVDFSEGGFSTLKQGSFSKIDFQSAVFKNLVRFSGRTFKDATQFYNVNFEDKVIFSNAVFEKEVQFLYCKVTPNTFISFEGVTFKKSLDISRSNFHHCNLRFWNIKIEGDENLSQYEKYINDFGYEKVEPSVYAKIRETYRIIKNAFYKEDNHIEGLEFYKREMAVYEKELKEKSCRHKDRIMLFLNKISNNYGTSWSRGLLFTFIVAFIFYICILISLHNSLEWNIRSLDAWDNFIKHFLEVINVTRWKDIEPFGVELNGFAYLSLFIGRIFIAYGYY